MEIMLLINTRKFKRFIKFNLSIYIFSFSSDHPVSSPTPSHHAAPIYMNTSTRTKLPHDIFVYPVLTSTPAASAQQPIHARQRFFFLLQIFSSLFSFLFLVHHLIFIQI